MCCILLFYAKFLLDNNAFNADNKARIKRINFLKSWEVPQIQTTVILCQCLHSITYDNGCEFSKHELVNEKLGCNSYFCKPYHAWEKGTVENINGLIRRFFPKGTNFDTITDEDIIKMENWINNLPMKVLGFKTPNEMALAA